jgi:hypothetical protein
LERKLAGALGRFNASRDVIWNKLSPC